MSLRSFTVFQDAPSAELPQPKVSRPGAMMTRSARLAMLDEAATSTTEAVLNKENLNPLTGERAGSGTNGGKKRKVLATKSVAVTKPKKEKGDVAAHPEPEPEQKKRKASASSATKAKVKKEIKGSASKKSATKRAGSRKVSPMPKVTEEEESEKERTTQQAAIDSRVYELTVKPLADVSEAYEEFDVFERFTSCVSGGPSGAEGQVKFSTVKESSVEPEIRDYYKPSNANFASASRLRALSEDIPETRTFSTPERKAIYAAFTFSSPSSAATRFQNASRSGSTSNSDLQ